MLRAQGKRIGAGILPEKGQGLPVGLGEEFTPVPLLQHVSVFLGFYGLITNQLVVPPVFEVQPHGLHHVPLPVFFPQAGKVVPGHDDVGVQEGQDLALGVLHPEVPGDAGPEVAVSPLAGGFAREKNVFAIEPARFRRQEVPEKLQAAVGAAIVHDDDLKFPAGQVLPEKVPDHVFQQLPAVERGDDDGELKWLRLGLELEGGAHV
jgi:hypothetical protein